MIDALRIFLLCFISIGLLNGCGSDSDNILENKNNLEAYLKEIGFFDAPKITLNIQKGSYSHPRFKGCKIKKFDVESILYGLGLMKYNYLLDVKPNGSYKAGISRLISEPSKAKMGNDLYDNIVSEGGTYSVYYGKRVLVDDSIEFRDWNDGNLNYVMATGNYFFQNYLSGRNGKLREFKLILEKNPASDNWYQSQYRGHSSNYDANDICELVSDILSLSDASKGPMEQDIKQVEEEMYKEIRKKVFTDHMRIDDITQVYLKNSKKYIMAHVKPKHVRDISMAEAYCNDLNAYGYSNWKVPEQYYLAAMLLGSDFSKWERRKLVDSPDNYFWGGLDKNLKGLYLGDYFITRQLIKEDDRYPERLLVLVHGIGSRNNKLGIRKEVIGTSQFEYTLKKGSAGSSGGGRLLVMCIDDDIRDNKSFRDNKKE